MEILPVVKLMEEDLEPLEAEKEESEEEGDPVEMEIKDEVLPDVKTDKPSIPEEDIFVDKKKPNKEEKPKKEKKPRKAMTEAQLEHLRKGREKALAVRRAKAQEKKELKELQAKKKKKEIQKLREEVGEAPAPKKAEPKKEENKLTDGMPTLQTLDPEFIRKLQQDAIEGYDKVRKERKAKKKQEQETYNRNTTNMNIINNALNPPKSVKYGDSNFFNHLF